MTALILRHPDEVMAVSGVLVVVGLVSLTWLLRQMWPDQPARVAPVARGAVPVPQPTMRPASTRVMPAVDDQTRRLPTADVTELHQRTGVTW